MSLESVQWQFCNGIRDVYIHTFKAIEGYFQYWIGSKHTWKWFSDICEMCSWKLVIAINVSNKVRERRRGRGNQAELGYNRKTSVSVVNWKNMATKRASIGSAGFIFSSSNTCTHTYILCSLVMIRKQQNETADLVLFFVLLFFWKPWISPEHYDFGIENGT